MLHVHSAEEYATSKCITYTAQLCTWRRKIIEINKGLKPIKNQNGSMFTSKFNGR